MTTTHVPPSTTEESSSPVWTIDSARDALQHRGLGHRLLRHQRAGTRRRSARSRPSRRASSTCSSSRTISRSRASALPVLLRFSDILRSRIESLTERFERAIEEFEYDGRLHDGVSDQGEPAAPRRRRDRRIRQGARRRPRVRQQAGAAGGARSGRAHGSHHRLQRLQGRGVHAPRPHGPEARAPGVHRARAAERSRRPAQVADELGVDADGRRPHQAAFGGIGAVGEERRREVEVRPQHGAAREARSTSCARSAGSTSSS